MGSSLRAAIRLAGYLSWTALAIPAQMAALALKLRLVAHLPVFYHRICRRIIGMDVISRGKIAAPGPVLFVANHSSYLDITVLGSLIPGSFIAKREVAGWPLFGLLAKLQRTVFVDRTARRKVKAQRGEIEGRLVAGDYLILFPEGTSDDGMRVLPFKSALLAAAETPIDGRFPLVQPVSITYTRLDGMPMGRALRPFFAWYGDMVLFPHLWGVLGLGVVTVEVTFHEPVTVAGFPSRKALADYCRSAVARGMEAALAGRAAETVSPQPPAEAAESRETAPAAAAGRP
jgi:1-acyl-sn-glycerol-3-phosphate acyltransferase